MNYCKDCKWFGGNIGELCTNPVLMKDDNVYGPQFVSAKWERYDYKNRCGPNGRLFEPKVPFWHKVKNALLG